MPHNANVHRKKLIRIVEWKKCQTAFLAFWPFHSFVYFINEIINSFFRFCLPRNFNIFHVVCVCFTHLRHSKRYLSLHIFRWHHTQRSAIYELIVTCSRMKMMKRSVWWCRRLQLYSTETTQDATTTNLFTIRLTEYKWLVWVIKCDRMTSMVNK